ncbi:MAG: hypothetical protein DRG78_16835 [Epsilonproteobacteria bacterium]|nr:MAG: hypothetical protein DRG78_16835 [Campylobacterota bacterium]
MKTTKNYKNYLKQSKRDLIDYSIKKENQIKKFKKSLEVINTKTQNLIKIQHNPLQDSKDNYLWFVYNQKLLEQRMAKSGDYTTLFITLTLNSSYHKYSSHSQSYNKNYNEDNTINKGYQLLNKSFRTIYKNFKIKKVHQKIFFSKVVEPHKDLTPHLHSIIYVKTQYVEQMKQHIKNTIKNNELGRYDIEQIEDINRSSSYLLKYVQKSTNPKSEQDFHFFNGWKKQNKIRVFTHSNLELPRYIFKKVNSILKLSEGLKDKNPISEVLEQCHIIVNTKDKSTKEITTKIYSNNSNSKYKVVINRTRKIHEIEEKIKTYTQKTTFGINDPKRMVLFEKIEDYEICEAFQSGDNYSNNFYDENIIETKDKIYDYKINDFKIQNIGSGEILYNKNDFMLLDKYKYKLYLNKLDI